MSLKLQIEFFLVDGGGEEGGGWFAKLCKDNSCEAIIGDMESEASSVVESFVARDCWKKMKEKRKRAGTKEDESHDHFDVLRIMDVLFWDTGHEDLHYRTVYTRGGTFHYMAAEPKEFLSMYHRLLPSL